MNDPLPSSVAEYDTEWDGFWGGVDLRYIMGKNEFTVRAVYQDYDYVGEANWILVDSLQHPKSFVHDADGDGYKIDAKYRREIGELWGFVASLKYVELETDSGEETNYLIDGSTIRQKFIGADWSSYSISAGVFYRF